MTRKSKSYRVDTRVSDAFTYHCYRLGLVVERVVEAMMIDTLTRDAGELGNLMAASAEWRETEPEPIPTRHMDLLRGRDGQGGPEKP